MAVGVVAEIKGRLPVADVVGETVQLKKAGTTLKGLCPFHGEKTPSFVVTPGRDTWHCFGCGKHGDIFTFVMERDTVGFPEALKILAGRAGVELDERTKQEDARNARLRTVLEGGIAFYHAVLTKSPTGETARAYLRGRGFTDATIEKHQLGWAPSGWDQLVRQLASKRQVSPQELLDVGLASPRQRGGGVYDRFRERVIFPIRDANGHPVGLGGRILPARSEGGGRVPVGHPPEDVDRGPKYLNSPATSLFDKSRTLYLIDRAKTAIRKSGQAVIVEGYTDALMAHQAGFENVVASLGTALTPGQVALITRYSKRIALAYDVDAAGQKAGTYGATALEELIRQLASDDSGVELDDVRVVRLPEGRDPDEVMRDNPDEWRELVRLARPIVDHLIDVHARAHDLKTAGGKSRFAEAAIEVIRTLPPLMRDPYLQQIQQVSGVSQGALMAALHEAGPRRAETRFTAAAVVGAADALPVKDILRGVSRTEQELLRLALLVPEAHDVLLDGLGPDRLASQVARELFRAIVIARTRDDHGLRPPFLLTTILDSLDEETRALGQALVSRPGPNPRDLGDRSLAYELERLMLELDDAEWQERSGFNRDAMAEAEREGDTGIYERLMLERRNLNEQRRSLDKRRDQTRLLNRPPVPTG